MGRIGEVEPCTLPEFAQKVKSALNAPTVLAAGNLPVRRVAVLGGSGSDFVDAAKKAGADTYLTGDAKHHEYLGAFDFGINLICAGHFFTEHPVCEFLDKTLGEICPDAVREIYFSNQVTTL
jgi:putative NIF3 family GTP cyclohydrolase 1 type 2